MWVEEARVLMGGGGASEPSMPQSVSDGDGVQTVRTRGCTGSA